MRVLVTGAAGQLGGDLLGALTAAGHTATGVDRRDGDVAAPGTAGTLLAAHRPDAVVNCAAYNAVDRAEAEPDVAMRVNGTAPGLLARGCGEAGVLLCHLSTDHVFDGTAERPYAEDDTPRPLSAYGRSKLAGEVAVLEGLDGAVVVRTAWLFGRTGPNFVLSVLQRAVDGSPLRVVTDEWGSPTWTRHLAAALVRLLEHQRAGRARGVVHLAGSGEATRYEQARAALDAAGLAHVAVEPCAAADLVRPAPRPRRSTLEAGAWRSLGEPPLPSWRDAVTGYVDELLDLGRIPRPPAQAADAGRSTSLPRTR